MQNDAFSDPSFDALEQSGAYDILANHGTLAHGLRAVGAGTVTVMTAAGVERTWTVNDGELVPCGLQSIVSMAGPTAVRLHIPRPGAQLRSMVG